MGHVGGFTIVGRHYQHLEDLAYLKMACPTPKGVTETGTLLKLSWLSATSLELTIPEGATFKIALTPTSNIPGEPTPDLYTGTLEGDPDSRVTVSGGKARKQLSALPQTESQGDLLTSAFPLKE